MNNTVWFNGYITREKREKLNKHLGCAIWLTGFSASGKSSIAKALETELYNRKCHTYVLDGDNVRHGLCADLGFTKKDRSENIRRIGEMVKLFVDAGIIIISAFISPIKKDREQLKNLIGNNCFIEVFVDCPIETCKQRDPKEIYKKAQQGIIKNFTGIDACYQKPENPNIHLFTDKVSIKESVDLIIEFLEKNKYIPNACNR